AVPSGREEWWPHNRRGAPLVLCTSMNGGRDGPLWEAHVTWSLVRRSVAKRSNGSCDRLGLVGDARRRIATHDPAWRGLFVCLDDLMAEYRLCVEHEDGVTRAHVLAFRTGSVTVDDP